MTTPYEEPPEIGLLANLRANHPAAYAFADRLEAVVDAAVGVLEWSDDAENYWNLDAAFIGDMKRLRNALEALEGEHDDGPNYHHQGDKHDNSNH